MKMSEQPAVSTRLGACREGVGWKGVSEELVGKEKLGAGMWRWARCP